MEILIFSDFLSPDLPLVARMRRGAGVLEGGSEGGLVVSWESGGVVSEPGWGGGRRGTYIAFG